MALCRDRILYRLRSKASTASCSKYKGQGRFIGDNLSELLRSPWLTKVARPDMTENHLGRYRTRSQALLEHLHTFEAENDQRQERVVKLVRNIAEFMAEVPLEKIIQNLKDHPMNKLAQHRLHNCLSKVARYRQSASFLARQAKNIPILRRVTVEHVVLEQGAFQRPSQPSGSSSLGAVLTATPHKKGAPQVNALPSWTQKSQQQFATKVRKVLRESKIHAEIQIVAHYEVPAPGVVLPRVIASSKDACYLCHAFINLHGKYSVPQSHGKLYTGWRVPAMRHLKEAECKLNDFLEQEIQTNVRKFAGMAKKPPVTLPNESTLFPLSISSSTLSRLSCLDLPSQVRHGEAVGQTLSTSLEVEENAETHGALQHHDPPNEPVSSALNFDCGTSDAANCSGLEADCEPEPCGVSADKRTHGCADKAKQHDETETITPGTSDQTIYKPSSDTHSVGSIVMNPQERNHALGESMEAVKKSRFRHKNMEIFIDDSSDSTTLRWLGPRDSAEVLRHEAEMVVDVLTLATGADTSFLRKNMQGVSYFAFGGQVIIVETGQDPRS